MGVLMVEITVCGCVAVAACHDHTPAKPKHKLNAFGYDI